MSELPPSALTISRTPGPPSACGGITRTASFLFSFSSMVHRPTTHLLLSLSLNFQPSSVVPLNGVTGFGSAAPSGKATARAARTGGQRSNRLMGVLLEVERPLAA